MICIKCGKQLPDDALFCNICGTKQEQPKKTHNNKCQKCGAEIIPGASFCNVCGNKIEKEPVCPKCGKKIVENMPFCAFCGAEIDGHDQSSNAADLKNEEVYNKACNLLNNKTKEDIEEAMMLFGSISGWKDSDKKLIEAIEQADMLDEENKEAEYLNLKKEMESASSQEEFVALAEKFSEYGNYSDASVMKAKCLTKVEEFKKDKIYSKACGLFEKKTKEDLESAIALFKKIKGWRDADKIMQEAKDIIDSDILYSSACAYLRKGSIEDYENAIILFERISGWRDSKEKIEEAKKEIQLAKERKVEAEERLFNHKYEQTINEMQSADSAEAFESVASKFDELNNYKNATVLKEQCLDKAEEYRKESIYEQALEKSRKDTIEDLEEAMQLFNQLSGWKDSDYKSLQCEEDIAAKKERGRSEKESQEQEEKDKLLLRLRMMK